MPPQELLFGDWNNDTASSTNIDIASGGDTFTLASAIPDSGLLHQYDWSDNNTTTSTVPDLAGSTDLTGTFTDLSATINGRQAGTFDGGDDYVNGDYPDVSEPYTIYTVARLRTSDSTTRYFIDGLTEYTHQFGQDANGDWELYQGGTAVVDGTTDTDAHLFTTAWGGTDVLRIDRSEVASGDSGSSPSEGLTVGSNGSQSFFAPVDVGEVLVYDPNESGYSQSDVEQYLVDKWGPF